MAQKNFGRQNCVYSSTTYSHKNYFLIFCGLGEERTRFSKKKKEKREKKEKKGKKKKKNCIAPTVKVAGKDEKVS